VNRSWRRAVVGLVAGAATVAVALPAPASPGTVAAGTVAARAVSRVAPARPLPSHRRHAVVKHAPATVAKNSKRVVGSLIATPAPATRFVPATGFAGRPTAVAAGTRRAATAVAARAPPARQ